MVCDPIAKARPFDVSKVPITTAPIPVPITLEPHIAPLTLPCSSGSNISTARASQLTSWREAKQL